MCYYLKIKNEMGYSIEWKGFFFPIYYTYKIEKIFQIFQCCGWLLTTFQIDPKLHDHQKISHEILLLKIISKKNTLPIGI